MRHRYLALAVGTIVLGLLVHFTGVGLGPVARDVVGDALWAAMMLWWISVLAPDRPLVMRASAALALCFAVEWTQRYHAPMLDALRHTSAGSLVLGSGFDPRDFASYAAGILVAAAIERAAVYANARRQAPGRDGIR